MVDQEDTVNADQEETTMVDEQETTVTDETRYFLKNFGGGQGPLRSSCGSATVSCVVLEFHNENCD